MITGNLWLFKAKNNPKNINSKSSQLMKNISLTFVLFLTATLLCGSWSKSSAKPFINNDSLVAFYPFNGNANDESGNGNDGIVNGADLVPNRYNNPDNAYQFNGTSDDITVLDHSSLQLTTQITLTAWVKRTRHGIDMILEKGGDWTGGTCNYGLSLHSMNNNMFYFFFNGGWRGTEGVIDFEWHHYAVVAKQGDANPLLYIDGILRPVQFSDGVPAINLTSTTEDLHIGSQLGNYPYYGANIIDEIRIYKRMLSSYEIFQMAQIDLVASYPFNGNAVDESGNGHDGTVYGGVLTADRNGNANSAYTFPNSPDQIVLSNSTNLNLLGGFTLNTWIKFKNADCHIISKHICYTYNSFALAIYMGQIELFLGDGGGWNTVVTNETFTENQWYMVSAVYDSVNKTASIFINGQIKASGTANYTTPNNAPITISGATGSCPAINMSGTVDEVKIFDRPLTSQEILAEYNSSQIGLVAFYPFNGNADDASGNLNHGIVNGAVLTTDRYGIADKAYYFDGGNSYIEGINPGNNLPSGSQQRTISCWVQSTEAIGDKNIFHYGTTEVAPTNYHLFLNLGNRAGVGNGYGYGTLISNTDIGDNAWHFVTGVYEGESTNLQNIFIDGKLDASAAISTTPNTVLSSNWKMGQFMSGSQSLLGKIDELRVFNIALNNQEIMNLYLTETTAPVLQQPANQTTVTTPTPLMQWNSLFTNAEYKIQLASDSIFTELLYEATTNNSSVQLPEGLLAVGITYYWRARTTLNGETGPWSEVWTFTYLNTGIQEPISGLPTLTVTPNPTDLYVKFIYSLPGAVASQKPVTIEIINTIGKPLANLLNLQLPPGVYETLFDTHRLESGIYFCRLKAGNHVLIRKLVVMH
jgi:hypothetical protein